MHLKLLIPTLLLAYATSAPVSPPTDNQRQQKSLYYDYIQPEEDPDYTSYETPNDDYVSLALESNELSRTVPTRKRIRNRPTYNSPVYYIRLPPQPYMYVPGLGYVSQQAPHAMSQFVNLPVSFVANGKPSTIYQWGGGLDGFPTAAPPPLAPVVPPQPLAPPVRPKPKPDSAVHRLPGQFTFNGKPNDIFVLRDSYNSLYGDALQNFYP